MTISVQGGSSGSKRRRKVSQKGGEGLGFILTVLKLSLPLCLLFGVAVGKVVLMSETAKLNKKATNIQIETHKLEREIANYNMQIEKSCGKMILAKIKQFKLDLQFPAPGQIRRLDSPDRTREMPEKIARSRANLKQT